MERPEPRVRLCQIERGGGKLVAEGDVRAVAPLMKVPVVALRSGAESEQLSITEFLDHVRTLRLRPQGILPVTAAKPRIARSRRGLRIRCARRSAAHVVTHALLPRERQSFLREFASFSDRNAED